MTDSSSPSLPLCVKQTQKKPCLFKKTLHLQSIRNQVFHVTNMTCQETITAHSKHNIKRVTINCSSTRLQVNIDKSQSLFTMRENYVNVCRCLRVRCVLAESKRCARTTTDTEQAEAVSACNCTRSYFNTCREFATRRIPRGRGGRRPCSVACPLRSTFL